MADTARARKLADRVREVVAEALEKRIKDPRLGFVTVTDARVTGDLQHATVFYTVLGDQEERAASAAALESAKGVLRSEVGRRTGIRLTPTLEFIADAIPENAAHIADLLRTAQERDADVAAQAARASYAGDPDPYRRPAEEIDDSEVDSEVDSGAGQTDAAGVGAAEAGDAASAARPAGTDPR
jgi:ribosome-binding factor A